MYTETTVLLGEIPPSPSRSRAATQLSTLRRLSRVDPHKLARNPKNPKTNNYPPNHYHPPKYDPPHSIHRKLAAPEEESGLQGLTIDGGAHASAHGPGVDQTDLVLWNV
jgi:hypothetical protein